MSTTDQALRSARLRAGAALWSLQAALAVLDDRAVEEYRAIADERAAAADPLKSPIWGSRQASGGHGDPTGDAILALGDARPNRWAELSSEVWRQLAEISQHLPGSGFNPAHRIATAVPAMSQAAAEATRTLADRIDGRIRRRLWLAHDRQLIPRVPCPACDATGLVVRTSPPLAARVVECFTCGAAWSRIQMLGSEAA